MSDNTAATDIPVKQLTFQIGGYSNKIQAEAEAKDFMNPTVFQYRSAFFPNPRNFKLDITPTSVVVKHWPQPPSPMNIMYIELSMDVRGDADMIAEWERRVLRSIKAFMPAAWGATSDRAAHLKETNRADPLARKPQVVVVGKGMGGEREQYNAEIGRAPATVAGAKAAEPIVTTKPSILEGLD